MKAKLTTWIAVLLCVAASAAQAYMVGPPLTLDKLTADAGIIFKGTVISSEPAEDAWFKPCPGFVVKETQFKIITVIKGENKASLGFRHYDESTTPQGRMFEPQFYHLEAGQTYIVFASKSETAPGVYRQMWSNHTTKQDQGVLLCPDNNPVTGRPVKEVIWNELMAMLKSFNPTRVSSKR